MKKLFLVAGIVASVSGCGTMTGIPSHGGGKRFAVEQELVSASARSALKKLDVSPLVGKKVSLFVTVIGDQGAGNISGGRYNLEGLFRGDYVNSPSQVTRNEFPMSTSVAETTTSTYSTVTSATSLLSSPVRSNSSTNGGGEAASVGVRTSGMGDFQGETLISNPRDVDFFSNLLQTVMFLKGVHVVKPGEADVDLFVTVDVFGTVRDRTDWQVVNAERLVASTKLEAFGIDRFSKKVSFGPVVSAYDAEYKEDYVFWVGPYNVSKVVRPSAPLLVDFSDVGPGADLIATPVKSTLGGEGGVDVDINVIDRRRD